MKIPPHQITTVTVRAEPDAQGVNLDFELDREAKPEEWRVVLNAMATDPVMAVLNKTIINAMDLLTQRWRQLQSRDREYATEDAAHTIADAIRDFGKELE